jgi:steroid 5-alpha reductase family enzyme
MTIFYFEALVAIGLALSILMAFAWLVRERTGNSGWVDTIWTFAVGLVGAGSALWPVAGEAPNLRQWLVAALVAVWSLRLGLHIAIRTAGDIGRPALCRVCEGVGRQRIAPDVRLPAKPGPWLGPAGICDLCCSAIPVKPAALAGPARRTDPADRHRRRGTGRCAAATFPCRSGQPGRVCDVGLWRWSRHPNYFFEWFCWLAYPVMGLSISFPWSLATLLAPVFMYWILVYVTGIPPLEEQMLRSRGERYRAYQLRTSKFFLLPPYA